MTAIISFFTSLMTVINLSSKLTDLFEQFMAFYIANRIKDMKKENADALNRAFAIHSQKEIEVILSGKSGELDSVKGSKIEDKIELWIK